MTTRATTVEAYHSETGGHGGGGEMATTTTTAQKADPHTLSNNNYCYYSIFKTIAKVVVIDN